MKSRIWILMAVLTLGLCLPQMAAAQGMFGNVVPRTGRGEVQGMFGTQSMDMPLRSPVQSIFGPQTLGLSMAPYSNRLGGRTLIDSMADFSNPGGVYGPTPLAQQSLSVAPPLFVFPELAPVPPSQPSTTVYNNLTEVQAAPATTSQTDSEANGTEGTNPTAEGQNATPSATPAATAVQTSATATVFPYVTQLRAKTPGAYASFVRPQSYNRSPELSDRLTRIARQKNMLAGQGIDVYLGDRVAVLKGVVRTSGDRSLLANVAGLEPEVQYVDNRLTTEGGASLSASRSSR